MEWNELIKAINNLSSRDFWDYFVIIAPIVITIVTTLVNVRLVNENTNRQIENQNKETYRPRLSLKNVKSICHDVYERHLYAYSAGFDESKEKAVLYVDVVLENVGNGLANDITFYMLNSGKKCLGIQVEDNDVNQELNSTLEIPKDSSYPVKFLFNFNRKLQDEELDADGTILLVCNYKDLNNNNFKILIGCILKKYEAFELETNEYGEILYNKGVFSIYYYQEGTKAYNSMVSMDCYKNNYELILKNISEEF